jgi:5-methylcytosine-specific restriction protein B
VIDEINRGNISKIFGELITLIEPSKRSGMDEALSVQLPLSQEQFSVPDNLYIIGTMNTADRSLALLDTALRRRFDFVEMMPDYAVLNSVLVNVDGIDVDIAKLLKTINQRIEALYDREHTLGHAFFMPLKQQVEDGGRATIDTLKSIFQNKVLPLLQEYFFDDWHKIRLVLGDNQLSDKIGQFITEKKDDFDALFGDKKALGEYTQAPKRYRLSAEGAAIWDDAAAYIRIYDPKFVAQAEEDEQDKEN